jgi:hypothetical protein
MRVGNRSSAPAPRSIGEPAVRQLYSATNVDTTFSSRPTGVRVRIKGLLRAGAASGVIVAVCVVPGSASTPPSDAIAVPATAGSTNTVTWTGTIPAGVSPSGTCLFKDDHATTVTVPDGFALTDTATFAISWSDPSQDNQLVVTDSSGNVVGSSDGSSNVEQVTLHSIAAGTYTISACPFTNTANTPYTGTLSISTENPVDGITDALRFTPATVVDPVLFGGEPGIHFDPTLAGRRSFVDWPVSSRQNIGVLFRSDDGGLSYTKRYADYSAVDQDGPACLGRQVPYCPSGGGGDTWVDMDGANGNMYFTSQESLANEAVGTSFNHGLTFPADHVDPVASQFGGDVDRQWLGHWEGTDTVFLAFHSPDVGEYVERSDQAGATGTWHNPTGVNTAQIPGVTQSGSMVVDNTGHANNHALYIGYIGNGLTSATDANGQHISGFDVGVSTDGGQTFSNYAIPGAGNARNFTKLAIDRVGNLYATWADSVTQKTYLSTSLARVPANVAHPGSTWSTPVDITAPGLTVTIFPDLVAGTPGRVDLAYYATAADAATPDDVRPGQGGWFPVLAQSLDALCQWRTSPCAAPTFTQSHIAERINQDDNICTSGTACAATGGNRNLLDYFGISLDRQGHLGIVWADGYNATKLPFIKVSRQASGPSLIAGQPDAALAIRSNGHVDAAGDAKYPIAGLTYATASNQNKLDLLGATAALKNGKVQFRLRLADASNLGAAVPGGGTGSDGATPLQQTKYLVRWDYLGNSYYAGANVPAGGVPTFFSGTVNNAEGLMAGGATAQYGNTYAAQTAATGSISTTKNTITITVPPAAVGSPASGASLLSVGAYTLIGPNDALATLNTAPLTVDSNPTFDATL